MPRAFDSDAHQGRHEFTENVDCPACGTEFEGHFIDETDSIDFEDMTEPPRGVHECPHCQRVFSTDLTGWGFYNEAG